MSPDDFSIESPEDLARWFKYHSAMSEHDTKILFKNARAKGYYQKFRAIYDNAFACLKNEGLDVKAFVDDYFKLPGQHSPDGFQAAVTHKCSTFYKNIRENFKKTVKNVCIAMIKSDIKSSRDLLKVLADTNMLVPNFLAGRISIFWLAGVREFSAITGLSPRSLMTNSFLHGDDFDYAFNSFLEQQDVYYHQLCLAFGGIEHGGVDSIAITDRQCMRQRERMK